jgi:hypothetical protein
MLVTKFMMTNRLSVSCYLRDNVFGKWPANGFTDVHYDNATDLVVIIRELLMKHDISMLAHLIY